MARLGRYTWVTDQLSIPGTHNSGSYKYSSSDTHRCQCATILQQLEAGIRFLDFQFVFIGDELRLSNGAPTMLNTVFAREAMGQIAKFLVQNPTEVVLLLLTRDEKATSNEVKSPHKWKDDKAVQDLAIFEPYHDTGCTEIFCLLGDTRGKIIYIRKDIHLFKNIRMLNYTHTFQRGQDFHEVGTIDDYYEKWKEARALLVRNSIAHLLNGSINNLSLIRKDPFYYNMSGQSSPKDDCRDSCIGGSCNCLNGPLSRKYPDFSRQDCTYAQVGGHSVCLYKPDGMNQLVYDWIDNGLTGKPQSHEVDYAFPRHQGVVMLDFPSNDLIQRIIDVNFAIIPTLPEVSRVPYTCGTHCECLAGDTMIETQGRGVIAARDVSERDCIRGGESNTWCKVVHTALLSQGRVYDNFTAGHLIMTNDVITPKSAKGTERVVDLVNIATECPVARTSSGVLFTPLSTAFCAEPMTMRDYLLVYQSIMRIMKKTGYFWFDVGIYSYQYNKSVIKEGKGINDIYYQDTNELRYEPSWSTALPRICQTLRSCANAHTDCDDFERTTSEWVNRFLPQEYANKVRASYPSLGDPTAEEGNLLQDVVHPTTPTTFWQKWQLVIIIAVLLSIVAILIIVAIYIYKRTGKSKKAKRNATAPMNEPMYK